MAKFWSIARYEYTRHVLRKRFLVTLLALPLWLLFSLVMGLASVLLVMNHAPVGYVDQAGLITQHNLPETQTDFISRVQFQPFASEDQARAALDAKKIQAYIVLPPDYLKNLDARMVYLHTPQPTVTSQISDLLRLNLMASQPPAVAYRVLDGAALVIQSSSANKQARNTDWMKMALPFIAGIFLMLAVFTSSGYLMQSMVEEKENRTMELLAASASPVQIMSGKISALICVGLTQMLAWTLIPLLGIFLVSTYTPFLMGVSIDWKPLVLVFITALPTFILIASLMAAIGATLTEAHEGQQVSNLVTMPVMLPFFLSGLIAMHPNGPLAVILSFFPLTASITLLIRLGFASIPLWQIGLSALILFLSAAGSLWLAGRIFRTGMLRYGKRMGWRDVIRAASPHSATPGAAPGKAGSYE